MERLFKPTLAVLATAIACAAHAQLINVDYKGPIGASVMGGAAYLGNPGDIWNGIISGKGYQAGGPPLLDSTGAVSTVTMSYYSTDGGVNSGVAAIQPNPALTSDYLQSSGGQSLGFELSGLVANGTYNLAAYIASDSSIAGDRSLYLTATGAPSFAASGNPDFIYINGEDVAYFQCQADSKGNLTVIETDGLSNTSGQVVLGGFQLQYAGSPTPEPATTTFAALTVVGLVRRKLRRSSRSNP